MQLFQYQV